MDGVIRPGNDARDEAEDVGRDDVPYPTTVGGDSLSSGTNTPHFGAHWK